MEIKQVELQNVKSYESQVIHFTPGVNAICGENGAGKTTILEAIGFALFDVLPYRRTDQFVREGAKTATIVVSILSSQDDREYQVVRKCGSTSQYYVYDPEIKSKLAEGKDDVLDWLADHLGVESSAELAVLFTDAVGVAQGQLTSVFQQTPANRKVVLDRLLRVDEYDQTFRTLLDTVHFIRDEIGKRQVQAASMEGEVKDLPKLQGNSAKFEESIALDQAELDQVASKLNQASQEKTTFDKLKERLDALKAKADALSERIKGLHSQQATANRQVTEGIQAEKIVAATKAAHIQYETAVSALDEFEQQRKERGTLDEKRNALEVKKTHADSQISTLNGQLKKINAAEREMASLQRQVSKQEKLEGELQDAEHQAESLANARQRLSDEQTALKGVENEIRALDRAMESRARLTNKRSTLKAKLDAAGKEIRGLEIESGQMKAAQDRLRDLLGILSDSAESTCPVCRQPLEEAHRKKVTSETREELASLKRRETDLNRRMKALARKHEQGLETLQNINDQIENLPTSSSKTALEKRLEKQNNTIKEWQGRVGELNGAPQQLKATKSRLKALNDPREAFTRLEGIAAERPSVEKSLESANKQKEQIAKDIRKLEEQRKPFADLEKKIEKATAERDNSAPEHKQYLQHIRTAESLSSAQKQLAKLQDALAAGNEDLENVKREQGESQPRYDPTKHRQAIKLYEDLSGQKQTLVERLRISRSQLRELQAEIKRLDKMKIDLARVQEELTEFCDILELIEYLRKLIKEAGPFITKRLVEAISIRAARLYGDIMSDAAARLNWEPDYEISLDIAGRTRTFLQLSGGEQMAAALAVRLALLREVSAIDVAFFDEPTANLDGTRRDNLADQIMNVRGFAQLFVISHDDTFERVTNNVVHVRKDDGVSQIA